MIIVADASAVGSFLLPDEQGRFADFARAACLTNAIHVPAHWTAEIANIIWKAHRRKRIGMDDANRIGAAASDLAASVTIELEVAPDRLARIAVDLGLTAYDASYLMLTQRLGASLLTGDGPLSRVAGEQGVPLLAP